MLKIKFDLSWLKPPSMILPGWSRFWLLNDHSHFLKWVQWGGQAILLFQHVQASVAHWIAQHLLKHKNAVLHKSIRHVSPLACDCHVRLVQGKQVAQIFHWQDFARLGFLLCFQRCNFVSELPCGSATGLIVCNHLLALFESLPKKLVRAAIHENDHHGTRQNHGAPLIQTSIVNLTDQA